NPDCVGPVAVVWAPEEPGDPLEPQAASATATPALARTRGLRRPTPALARTRGVRRPTPATTSRLRSRLRGTRPSLLGRRSPRADQTGDLGRVGGPVVDDLALVDRQAPGRPLDDVEVVGREDHRRT